MHRTPNTNKGLRSRTSNAMTKSNVTLLVMLLMLSTWFNAASNIYIGETKRHLKDRFNEHRRPKLNPSGGYIQTAVQNTFSAIATLFPICYLSQLKHLDMNAIVLGKHVRHTSFIKPKPSTLWEWTNVTSYNHYVIFVFFSVYFS